MRRLHPTRPGTDYVALATMSTDGGKSVAKHRRAGGTAALRRRGSGRGTRLGVNVSSRDLDGRYVADRVELLAGVAWRGRSGRALTGADTPRRGMVQVSLVLENPMSAGHTVTITPSDAHVEVRLDGELLATTDHALRLDETGLPSRYYL